MARSACGRISVSTAFSSHAVGQAGTQGPGHEMRGGGAHPALAMARISLAVFMAGFATFSLIYSAQPLLPEFTAEFAVDPATSSLALSLTTGCLAVSILCVGALSETWGRRGLMFASICGAALLNLVSSVAPTWDVLLVVRSLEGLVLGGVPAVAMAYLSEEIPPDRLGRAMGLYVGGTAFGGMIGRVAIGSRISHPGVPRSQPWPSWTFWLPSASCYCFPGREILSGVLPSTCGSISMLGAGTCVSGNYLSCSR